MSTAAAMEMNTSGSAPASGGCDEWLVLRVGAVPRTSLGWFRCGVGFYNKKEYTKAIECFEKSVQMDPMNVLSLYIFIRIIQV